MSSSDVSWSKARTGHPTAGKSSVADRVKWIEKVHGPSSSTSTLIPKARPVIPKIPKEPARPISPKPPAVPSPLSTKPVSPAAHSGLVLPQTQSTQPQEGTVPPGTQMNSELASTLPESAGTQMQYPDKQKVSGMSNTIGFSHTRVPSTTSYTSSWSNESSTQYGSPSPKITYARPELPKEMTEEVWQIPEATETASVCTAPARFEANTRNPKKSLGGVSSRAPMSIRGRRYGRTQVYADDRSESGSSDRAESPVSTDQVLYSSRSLPHLNAESAKKSSTLLQRLNDLKNARPIPSELVSNRSSPKFVKRSQFQSKTDYTNKILHNGKRYA